MSLKEEVVENACSQLSLAEPSEGSCAAAAHTDSKIARTVSGHKRSVPATAATERRNHAATGQQLLQLEVQLQGLLGIRKDEDGTNNICWVDHGFLHYAQGVLYFHGFYGDAECAQVTASWPLSCDINCQSVYSELYHYTIWFCSQQCTLSSSITTAIPSTLYQCEGHTSTSYCLPRCHPQSPLHVIISCKVPQTSSFNAVMHTAQICMLVRPCR